MTNLNHQNIVGLYGYGQDGVVQKPSGRVIKNLTYIVMEYVKGDLLFDFVKDFGGIGEEKSRNLMNQMVNTLQYLKDKNTCHRDLKLENIMVTEKFQLKVADFGFAKQNNVDRLSSYRGTKTYMAPEIKEGRRMYSGLKADIFSTGVVLFAVVTGIFPFTEATKNDKYYNLLKNKKYNEYWSVIDKHSKARLSSEFKNLMQQMLAHDPSDRPQIE